MLPEVQNHSPRLASCGRNNTLISLIFLTARSSQTMLSYYAAHCSFPRLLPFLFSACPPSVLWRFLLQYALLSLGLLPGPLPSFAHCRSCIVSLEVGPLEQNRPPYGKAHFTPGSFVKHLPGHHPGRCGLRT